MSRYPMAALGDFLTPDSNYIEVDPDTSYRIVGMYNRGRGLFARPTISGTETTYRRFNRLREGQVIYSKLFGWEGALGFVTEQFHGFFASQEFPTFSVTEGLANADYVRHLLTWPQLHAALSTQGSGMGSRRQRVNPDRFLSATVPLPDLFDQRRIAAKLDNVTGTSRRITEMRKLGDDHRLQHLNVSLSSISRSAELSEALTLVAESTMVETTQEYRIAGLYSFGRGLIDRGSILGSTTSYRSFTRLREEELVISKLNAWEGALAVVPREFSGAYVSGEFPVFQVNQRVVNLDYLRHLILWPALWDRLTPRGSMVRRKRTSPAMLLSTEVPLPHLHEQREIARRLSTVRETKALGALQIERLVSLHVSALNAAFEGRL